jgi:hypothetical protein
LSALFHFHSILIIIHSISLFYSISIPFIPSHDSFYLFYFIPFFHLIAFTIPFAHSIYFIHSHLSYLSVATILFYFHVVFQSTVYFILSIIYLIFYLSVGLFVHFIPSIISIPFYSIYWSHLHKSI